MNSVDALKEAWIDRLRRSNTVKRLMRRERVPVATLAFAIICCLMLIGTYRGQGTYTGQSELGAADARPIDVPDNVEKRPNVDEMDPLGPQPPQWVSNNNNNNHSGDMGRAQQNTDIYPSFKTHPTNDQKKYIEVLDRDYRPKNMAMPSWLPKSTSNNGWSGNGIARLTNESRMILANNNEVSPHTAEPDSDSILILTPVKNNAKHLARYFALIDKLQYPRSKISIAFLVSDSTDRTQQMLIESRQWYQEKAPVEMRFKRFDIYRQDFFYALPRNQRHLREKQQERRIMMARARNYLWTRALENEQWVLWIDGDLEFYPPNIVRDLMAYDKDVIVPNCLVRRKADKSRWKHSVYDRNAWQETPRSLAMIKKLKETDFLVEGYKSLKTHRRYLDNFSKNDTLVPLDGVGGTFTLVKAHVHRSGVGFPAWLFQHQVETEGFAKLAKAHGYGVFGLPFYYIRHVVG